MESRAGRIAFVVAAGLPALALLAFAAIGVHEWWLIHTHQITVIPRPVPGQSSVPNMPASNALILAAASAAFAGLFAYAWLRRSRLALAGGWLLLVMLAVAPRIVQSL